MNKKVRFIVYCMEWYRHDKGISGEETSNLFEQYELYSYLSEFYESLHTMGDKAIVQDIDEQIASMKTS